MAAVSFVIPGAPTGKGRPRVATVGGHARAVTPAKTRSREGIVASLAMDAMFGRVATARPVEVSIAIEAPIPTSWSRRKKAEAVGKPCSVKPDIDNVVKLVLDAINGIVFVDDKQVVSLVASKIYSETARTTVQITEISR